MVAPQGSTNEKVHRTTVKENKHSVVLTQQSIIKDITTKHNDIAQITRRNPGRAGLQQKESIPGTFHPEEEVNNVQFQSSPSSNSKHSHNTIKVMESIIKMTEMVQSIMSSVPPHEASRLSQKLVTLVTLQTKDIKQIQDGKEKTMRQLSKVSKLNHLKNIKRVKKTRKRRTKRAKSNEYIGMVVETVKMNTPDPRNNSLTPSSESKRILQAANILMSQKALASNIHNENESQDLFSTTPYNSVESQELTPSVGASLYQDIDCNLTPEKNYKNENDSYDFEFGDKQPDNNSFGFAFGNEKPANSLGTIETRYDPILDYHHDTGFQNYCEKNPNEYNLIQNKEKKDVYYLRFCRFRKEIIGNTQNTIFKPINAQNNIYQNDNKNIEQLPVQLKNENKNSHHLLPQINTQLYPNQTKTGDTTPVASNTHAKLQAPLNQNIYQGQHPFQPTQYIQSLSKNEDPLEKLTNRMLKTAKYAEIRRFKMGNDPSFNRKNFNYFITDLQNVCELIPQTRNIFYKYPQSSPTANKVTDEALFILMLSRTEGYAKDLIKPLTGHGCEAIITLQRHCSQITPEDQARVRRSIILLRQQRN
jgi:hypothetical protein